MAKAPAKTTKKKTFKKKEKKVVNNGLVHIQASFNNTIVTFTYLVGNVLAWSSSGSLGFRGSRTGTQFSAQQASLTAPNKAKEYGLRSVEVRVSGPGSGREYAGGAGERDGHCFGKGSAVTLKSAPSRSATSLPDSTARIASRNWLAMACSCAKSRKRAATTACWGTSSATCSRRPPDKRASLATLP